MYTYYILCFTAGKFMVTKYWKISKSPGIRYWLGKLCYIHIIEYPTVIKIVLKVLNKT